VILLDTHALVWLVEGLPQLGKKARTAADLALAEERLTVSAIAFWEITMLENKARLRVAQPVGAWRASLIERGLIEIQSRRDRHRGSMPLGFHADPADRIITATAALNRATLMTADDRILRWSGKLTRIDARV